MGTEIGKGTEMSTNDPAGWLVYRCSGTETGALEAILREAYLIETWTPQGWVRKRLPRRRAKVWVLSAVLPTFLFLRVHPDAASGLASVCLKHKIHGPMLNLGKVVVIPDAQLNGLRAFDNRRPPTPAEMLDAALKGPKYERGATSDGSQGAGGFQIQQDELTEGTMALFSTLGMFPEISVGDRIRIVGGIFEGLDQELEVEQVSGSVTEETVSVTLNGRRLTLSIRDVAKV